MASNAPIALPKSYPSRRGWLIAFGIVEILIAGGFVLMILVTALGLYGPAHRTTAPNGFRPGVVMVVVGAEYAVLAAVFIIAGIGSIRCRNWARILMLVVSGLWLALGILMTVAMSLIFPTVMRQQSLAISPEAAHIVIVGILMLLIATMVVLPAIFLVFYCLRSVRATCLASRTAPADGTLTNGAASARMPVPLLILGALESIGAVSVLACVFIRVTVFFGVVLQGLVAVLYFLAYSLFSGFAAWLIFRRKLLGWQISIVKTALMVLSLLVTWVHIPDMVQLYRMMGFNSQALQIYGQFPQLTHVIWGSGLVFWCGLIYFIYYTRRYFPNE